MIRLDAVTVHYPGHSIPALANVSVDISSGEFAFLVGRSGSGKSTFLRLVLREAVPTSGRAVVAGQDLARLSIAQVPGLRRRIGAVFQDFRLLANRTVAENVAFALQVLGSSPSRIAVLVPEVLELVGLAGQADRFPDELSGGEQQRVAIARALINSPPLLLADEPTGNLDPSGTAEVIALLDRINRNGTTVVMATHDDRIVDSLRRRVVELDGGRVVRDEASGVYGYAR